VEDAITGPFIVVEAAVGFTIHAHSEDAVLIDWKFSDPAPRDIGSSTGSEFEDEGGKVGILR